MSSWSLESWENSTAFVKSYIWLACYTSLYFNFGTVLHRLYKIWELFCMFDCLFFAPYYWAWAGLFVCCNVLQLSHKHFLWDIFVCLLHHIIGRGDCTRRPLGAITHPWKGGELHLLPYIRITCKTCGKDSEDRKLWRSILGAMTHLRKLLPCIRITYKTCGKDSEDRKTCWSIWKEREQ